MIGGVHLQDNWKGQAVPTHPVYLCLFALLSFIKLKGTVKAVKVTFRIEPVMQREVHSQVQQVPG